MSYTKNYSTTITVSGSRSVSYPKSESGGTMNVSFSVSEPVNIAVHVDTSTYDESVDDCESQLDLVTGTVVATQALQIEGKRSAAEEISHSLLSGFFKAVRSELGQQMAELRSQSDACLLEMGQLGKACSGKRGQMQEDFQRISERYSKVFEELDRELQRRIMALDQPAFDLMRTDYLASIGARLLNLPGTALTAGREGIETVSLLQVARARRMMSDLVGAIQTYSQVHKNLERRIERILRDSPLTEAVTVQLPVLLMECLRDEGLPGPERQVLTPEAPHPAAQAALARVADHLSRDPQAVEWKALEPAERELLDREFGRVLASRFPREVDKQQQRVVDVMMALWRRSTPLTAVKRN